MMFLFGLLLLVIASFANAGTGQKLEGQCSGLMDNSSLVNFSYYSDYDGCSGTSGSSISFSSESGLGLHNGQRNFENQKDIYTFKNYRLSFDDSTGNVSGVLDYQGINGEKHSITVQCAIRDYEYGECQNQN